MRASEPYLDRLDGLDPPAADRAAVDRWRADLRVQQDTQDALADAIAAGDEAAAKEANNRIGEAANRARDFARDFGMPTCGS